jgi:uncharacterized integral membrane protein
MKRCRPIYETVIFDILLIVLIVILIVIHSGEIDYDYD